MTSVSLQDTQHSPRWSTLLRSIEKQLSASVRLLSLLQEHLLFEQDCIRRHELHSIESHLERKQQIVIQIQQDFAELRKNIAAWMGLMGIAESEKLSDFAILLQNILQQSNIPAVHLAPLRKCLQTAREALELFQRVQHTIDCQKLVNSRMMEHLQLSYKFWIDAGKELESSYNAKATRKEPVQPISQIEVKI